MTIDLRLHVLGLAAYVPEDGAKMHLLLPFMRHADHPAAPHGDTPGVSGNAFAPLRDGTPFIPMTAAAAAADDPERHHPRLMFDLAYLTPNQPELARSYELVNFEGRVLDLSGLDTGSEGFEPRLPHELPDLHSVSHPVPRQLVTQLPNGRLAGRVTVDSGALTRYALGASFHLNDISVSTRMAFETEWTIRGVRPEPDENGVPRLPPLVVRGPGAADELALPPLYPIAQTVQLTVFNAVSTAFPPRGALFRVPKPTESTHHFLAYHGLSRARHNPPRKPVAADVVEVPVRGDVPTPVGPHLPGVICVQVQTRLESE